MKTKHRNLLFIGLALTASICIALSYLYHVKLDTEREAAHNIQEQMEQSNTYISRAINKNITLLQAAAESLVQRKYHALDDTYDYLEAICSGYGFAHIIVGDKNGILYARDGTVFDFSGREDYLSCKTGGVYISDIKAEQRSDKKYISTAVPVVLEDGTVNGFLIAYQSYENLYHELISDFYDKKGYSYIVKNDGEIIFHSETAPYRQEYTNYFQSLTNLISGTEQAADEIRRGLRQTTAGTQFVKGTEYNTGEEFSGYIGYTALYAHPEWNIICVIPYEKAGIFSQKIVRRSMAMVSGIVVLIFLAALYLLWVKSRQQRQLAKAYYSDSFTQIGNREYFEMTAGKLLGGHPDEAYEIIRFDINHFKYVNDNFGYQTGDAVLKQIAAALQDRFQDGEVCARVNSDHFAVMMKEEKETVRILDGLLHKAVRECVSPAVEELITFSFGIYRVKEPSETIIAMLDKANIALKEAKQDENKQTVYYDETFLQRMRWENNIESNMKAALEKQEYQIYLQPKFCIKTEKYIGAEALVRWDSPVLGILQPGAFVPLFEKNGFIAELDFYVLETVCERIRRLREKKVPVFPISVNQSRVTILRPDYLPRLSEVLERYQLSNRYIELEVTESIFIGDYRHLLTVIRKVKELGFAVSMDDFGSGYSSLNLLRQLPIDVLKIDRVFLDESAVSPRSRTIIWHIIQMAKELGVQVVCEGVENERQEKLLKELGCEVGQGYYFSKPLPMDEFDRRMKQEAAAGNVEGLHY